MSIDDSDDAGSKSGTGRSRGYPSISLEDAVERARAFWQAERKNAAPATTAASHWGYSEKSSGGRQVLATLGYFGLLQDEGSGDDRKVRLTQRAFDILLNEDSAPSRIQALRDAARQPKLYSELFSKFDPLELPSDQSLAFYLQREIGILSAGVPGFLKNFRATIRFSRLDESVGLPDGVEAPTETVPPGGSRHIVPVSGSLNFGTSPSPLQHSSAPFREEVFSLEEGPVHLRWPGTMSKDSFQDFRDWVELLVRKIGRTVGAELISSGPKGEESSK